jgi:hypothetical protein
MADSDYICCSRCNEIYLRCTNGRNAGTGLCSDCFWEIQELIRTGGEERKK